MFRKLSIFSRKKKNPKSGFRNNRIIRSFLLAPQVLVKNEVSKEACVLSYYGLFSCIPILVFFLRLSQHLFANLDWKEWLLVRFPDYKEPILAIVAAAHNATTSNIGLVLVGSFFVFCWAGILMLLSLEDGLNKIFRTGWTPISVQRLIAYFIITLVSPMIFIIVCGSWIYITQIMPVAYAKLFSLSHSITILYVFSRLTPYLFIYLALFCCYAFLPRVSVQKTAALIAALTAGTLWIFFQKVFFCLQFYLFNYSFTYGALVALPSFLLLLYLYAMLYLFGGAFTFLIQNQGCNFILPTEKYLPNCYVKLVVCTYILSVISRDFDEAFTSPTARSIAKNSKIPIGEIFQSLDILENEGLILSYKKAYKPTHNISGLTIKDVVEKLLHLKTFNQIHPDTALSLIQSSLRDMFDQATKSPYNLTLSDIAGKIK
ncbi:YhjD/YihY/BrkB family envelope integrity protein [Chlamydia caviae]|uniref:Ribonuclease BN family protein n=1 Tax=Chlamydia caviae (strain ATCC VR-813 / DSM 19441 / 03DC25 / GPIC) TaxID=227941 RepID=Q822X8_CHLCV|nr:YhjD/YihY/BrkB family envelope integrity protein [Chlamydia caviae]AAP05291.1 ribonuclease BN family protein [Chlamydia caviae GPIC]